MHVYILICGVYAGIKQGARQARYQQDAVRAVVK